ncbi:hypothetical protein SAZ_34080 [Streptomyces noursei ZPM]|nr:hypothetical protein SAZ_34080 [Streptomyces noursei ZPM]EPY93570.1 hypothetical protein K530_47350 [Streptomyces noursei CCRC 11814]
MRADAGELSSGVFQGTGIYLGTVEDCAYAGFAVEGECRAQGA